MLFKKGSRPLLNVPKCHERLLREDLPRGIESLLMTLAVFGGMTPRGANLPDRWRMLTSSVVGRISASGALSSRESRYKNASGGRCVPFSIFVTEVRSTSSSEAKRA